MRTQQALPQPQPNPAPPLQKPYNESHPFCSICQCHHPACHQCTHCNRFGHLSTTYSETASVSISPQWFSQPNPCPVQYAQPVNQMRACYNYGDPGHFCNVCPRLVNVNLFQLTPTP